MKDQLKKVLTTALEEKYPEVKNIIIIQNEFIENNFDCALNIDYEDFLKMDATELKTLIKDYAKYLGVKIDTVVFYQVFIIMDENIIKIYYSNDFIPYDKNGKRIIIDY